MNAVKTDRKFISVHVVLNMGSPPPLVDFRRDPLVVIKENAGVNTVIAVWSKTTAQRAPNELQRSLFPIQLVCMLIMCFFFPFVFVIYYIFLPQHTHNKFKKIQVSIFCMCGHHFFYKITKDIFHSLLHTLVFSVHIYLTLLHVNNFCLISLPLLI